MSLWQAESALQQTRRLGLPDLQDILGQWLKLDSDVSGENDGINKDAVPLDLTQFRKFTDGDRKTEIERINAFIQQSDKNLPTLGKNRSGADNRAWGEVAHMLKGGAGGIGAEELRLLSDEAQNFAGTRERRAELFGKIGEKYERVKAYLRDIGLIT